MEVDLFQNRGHFLLDDPVMQIRADQSFTGILHLGQPSTKSPVCGSDKAENHFGAMDQIHYTYEVLGNVLFSLWLIRPFSG